MNLKKEIKNWEVLTPNGWSDFTGIKKTKVKKTIKIFFNDNSDLQCTLNHKILIPQLNIFKKAKDLKINDEIIYDDIKLVIIKLETINENIPVYDLLNVEKNNQYFTNSIISHNCAFIPTNFMEEFWKSTIPVISSSKTSKLFVVSTPNGTGNKFFEIYTAAERGEADGDWHAEKIDWFEVPGRDETWKKQMISALGSTEAFDQEFGNNFLNTGESAINTEVLIRYRTIARNAEIELDDKRYKIWEKPQAKKIYVFGIDVGEGIGSCASVIQILDITDLRDIKQVAVYRSAYVDPYHFSKEIYKIALQWGKPHLLIERNNCGGEVVSTLSYNYHYENIVTYAPKTGIDATRLGIVSSTSTKFEAVSNMRYWMNALQVVSIPDIATVQELETFIRYPNGQYKKKGGEKIFDDRVMGLVWALFILNTNVCEQFFDILEYDDQGRPQKIANSNYDETNYFGNNVLEKEFNTQQNVDGDLAEIFFMSPKENSGVEDLESEGWITYKQR